ncbi:TPA: DUF4176 domain-containing protein [Streptococcus agalactiae]|nr:DUF4176 domain-containing protein [Streptococcus agalactiae]HEN0282274.1 DUF4176 domain-containing protein [Streptococcus agalactiae]HEN0369472.1 DUF4176 domain-containing protein [Streptococcus agalactiae]HEN0553611.1 DUF4176 domain-containing protein [Streptococcus agalactiae]HEN4491495.1 DUF4176 domain-containing protein [Streptococcus agalactiae]
MGTTVILKHCNQPITIAGRYQQNNEGVLFDYSGVLNPQGFEDASNMYLFNESKIDSVIFEAPTTNYEDKYIELLNQFIEKEEH